MRSCFKRLYLGIISVTGYCNVCIYLPYQVYNCIFTIKILSGILKSTVRYEEDILLLCNISIQFRFYLYSLACRNVLAIFGRSRENMFRNFLWLSFHTYIYLGAISKNICKHIFIVYLHLYLDTKRKHIIDTFVESVHKLSEYYCLLLDYL